MPGRPLKERVVYHEDNLDTDLPVVTTVPDLSDHPLGKSLKSKQKRKNNNLQKK